MMKSLSKLIAVFPAMIFLFTTPSYGQEVNDFDKFQLWNDCQGVRLVVEDLPKDATAISLTKEAITTTVRSRLRGARIYSNTDYRDDGNFRPYLYVNVNVVERAFSVDFELNKVTHDPLSNNSRFAGTWAVGATGTHGDDADYIIASVAQDTDLFIDEYLRVNAEAC